MAQPDFLDDTRAFYDALADDYQHLMGTTLDELPLERSQLTAFAALVGARGQVLDVGSGPGRVTAFLSDLGLDCTGVDLSPVMVSIARAAFPSLIFEVGSITDLGVPDASLDGLLAWYSLIHIPPRHRQAVLAEVHRALRPGGHLLLAFQVGEDIKHVVAPDGRLSADGAPVALGFHRLSPDEITRELTAAGFTMIFMTVRQPQGRESTPQACLLAQRP